MQKKEMPDNSLLATILNVIILICSYIVAFKNISLLIKLILVVIVLAIIMYHVVRYNKFKKQE